jgi:hypothetical protein
MKTGLYLLGLLLMAGLNAQAQAQAPTLASSRDSLIAIDVLLLPDVQGTTFSQSINAKLREQYPQGYALDDTHHPHITLLQRYVRARDMGIMEAAIQKALMGIDVKQIVLKATSYFPAPSGAQGLLLMEIDPTAELKALQAKIINAVQPFAVNGGTASAFIQDRGEQINQFTIDFVEGFVGRATGDKFLPHITLGLAPMPYLNQLKDQPFPAFTFRPTQLAIFHLGNFGTARERLWATP